MTMLIIWQIVGLISAIASIALLYLAWSKKKRTWPLVIAAWVVVSISLFSWAKTSGVDKGPALGVVVLVLAALIGVLIVALRTPIKARRAVAPRMVSDRQPASVWHEGLAVSRSVAAIVFIGLIVAISGCTAAFMMGKTAGLEHTANLTITMTAFPLVWAAVGTYIGYASNKLTKNITLIAMFAVSTIIILFTMQG